MSARLVRAVLAVAPVALLMAVPLAALRLDARAAWDDPALLVGVRAFRGAAIPAFAAATLWLAVRWVAAAAAARWPGLGRLGRSGGALIALAALMGWWLEVADVPAAIDGVDPVPRRLLAAAALLALLASVERPLRAARTGRPLPRGLAWAGLVSLTVTVGALALAAGLRAAQPERPNVLLVVVDCLRADRLGAYGYRRPTTPTLDRIAAQGVRYDRAYTPANWTKPAIASLLSGRLPTQTGVRRTTDVLSADEHTLAEVLAAAGYRTMAFGGNSWLTPAFGMHQGYETFDVPQVTVGAGVADAALAAMLASPEPFFAYVHFMDVHTPYSEHPLNSVFAAMDRGQRLIQPGYVNGYWVTRELALGRLDDAERAKLQALYDAQVYYVDHQLGRMLQGLADAGQLAHTWVVIVADHGEELGDHGNFEHGHALFEELVRVPLLVMGPSTGAHVVTAPVSLIDVAPTILQVAGVGHDLPFAGRALPPFGPGRHEAVALAEGTLYGADQTAAVGQRYKRIDTGTTHPHAWVSYGRRPDWGAAWFDLLSDPGEARPSVEAPPAAHVQRALDRARAAAAAGAPSAAPVGELDAETVRRLRALGYAQ